MSKVLSDYYPVKQEILYILINTKQLLNKQDNWIKESYAGIKVFGASGTFDKIGVRYVDDIEDPQADCFCLSGAIKRSALKFNIGDIKLGSQGEAINGTVLTLLHTIKDTFDYIGGDWNKIEIDPLMDEGLLAEFNDNINTSYEDVLLVLDKSIEVVKGLQQ